MSTALNLAAAYFESWQAEDFDRLEGLLHPDVTFEGPLATIAGRDDVVQGLRGLAQITDHLVIRTMQGDDRDVITWFDLHTTIADPAPTANWMRNDGERIETIRVTFDPRGILAAGR